MSHTRKRADASCRKWKHVSTSAHSGTKVRFPLRQSCWYTETLPQRSARCSSGASAADCVKPSDEWTENRKNLRDLWHLGVLFRCQVCPRSMSRGGGAGWRGVEGRGGAWRCVQVKRPHSSRVFVLHLPVCVRHREGGLTPAGLDSTDPTDLLVDPHETNPLCLLCDLWNVVPFLHKRCADPPRTTGRYQHHRTSCLLPVHRGDNRRGVCPTHSWEGSLCTLRLRARFASVHVAVDVSLFVHVSAEQVNAC